MLEIKKKQIEIRWEQNSEAIQHMVEEKHAFAVNMALRTGRPLLLKGEPGVGKSQFALAVAHELKLTLLYHVVNAKLEAEDLLFQYDAVARLAEAQIQGSSGKGDREELAPSRFIRPSELWWAINPDDAREKATIYHRGKAVKDEMIPGLRTGSFQDGKGCVVLIDEIDKAHADVPNSLLEVFSLGSFSCMSGLVSVTQKKDYVKPLVIITTNEDKELPAAFIRRCLVLDMSLPKKKEETRDLLMQRARLSYSEDVIEDSVINVVFNQLWEDRQRLEREDLPKPGQAEFLDMLKSLAKIEGEEAQMKEFRNTQEFVFAKY